MSSAIVSIEDIIDDVKKNIKMVFQNRVRAEDQQDRVVGVFDYPELYDYLRVRLKDILA